IAAARNPAPRSSEPDKSATMDPAMALYLASAQQAEDVIIGLWSGTSNGMNRQRAIVKNPNHERDGYDYIGAPVQLSPLYFQKGEANLYLKKTSSIGIYDALEKWRSNLGWTWAPARITLHDPNSFQQSNKIDFASSLGTEWTLARQPVSGGAGPT